MRKRFKRTDPYKKEIVVMPSKRGKTKVNAIAKRVAKKAAKQTGKMMKKQFKKRKIAPFQKKTKLRRMFSARAGGFRKLGAIVAANAGFRAKLSQTRVKDLTIGRAPNHPTMGRGYRLEFSYACREIRRTGDQNTSATMTDGVTGALVNTPKPIRQDDYVHIFALEDGTNPVTYRYDQGVSDTIWNWYDGTDAKNAMVSSCVFVAEEKGKPIPTQISDTLKYYETYFVRSMWYEYKPTVPKTTPGNLVFAVLKKNGALAVTQLDEYEESTYNEIVGVNGHVETQVSAPCRIPVIVPQDMDKALQGSGIEVDSGNNGIAQSNVLIGAVDTLLTAGQHDKLGTLVVHWIVDAYSKHWDPELIPSDSAFLELRRQQMLKRQMQEQMFDEWIQKNDMKRNQEFESQIETSREMLKEAKLKESGSTSACVVSSAPVLKTPENRPLSRSMRTDLEALVKKMKEKEEKEGKDMKELKESKN